METYVALLRAEERVEHEAGVGERVRGEGVAPLHAARVRRARAPELRGVRAVPEAVCAAPVEARAEERRGRVRDGVVQHRDRLVVELVLRLPRIRQWCVRRDRRSPGIRRRPLG